MAFGNGFKRKASGNAQKRKGGWSYATWKAANDAAAHIDEDVPPVPQDNNDVALGDAAGMNMPPVAQAAAGIDEVSDTVSDEHSTVTKKE